ncbi:phospholipase D family protein [Microvirga aerophila]|uniref:Phospholipase D-like domain-containing protein n=1 Tax=Microvirga aerophila TaxID=670291 RepID=A0A512BWB2_9HYPH|nr:phospholipase D family protein [Microvirga aerophila]GEO16233.1 hypothetical protein MAE02_39290 [Microvirga aerophila]
MIKVLSEKELAKFVRTNSSEMPVRLAVAFWGKGAVKRLGLLDTAGGEIICNLQSGCTNPDEVLKLIKNFEVRTHGKLHGKLYKTPEIAVGSSNASLNGLAVEGETEGWREINLAVDDRKTLNQLDERFGELWDEADPVDENVVESYRPIWKRKQARGVPPPSDSLLEAARKNPNFFVNQTIYFAISRAYVPKEQRKEIKAQVEAGKAGKEAKSEKYSEYVGWDPFPPESWFIDVTIVRKTRVHGIERTFDKPPRLKLKSGDNAQLMFKRPYIEIEDSIFKLSKTDIQLITDRAMTICRAAKGEEEGCLVSLGEAMKPLGII